MDNAAHFNVVTRENWIDESPVAVRNAILARMTEIAAPAGTLIAEAGEPCTRMFQIVEGYVRLSGLHEDGSEALITIYAPGNCYAETALVARRPYNHTSIALVDCRVNVLREHDFWELYYRHREIPEALCRKFAGAITRQIASREARATLKLGKRIAMMFENFAVHCPGEPHKDWPTIAFPITQNDIATLFDVTRQTVHREISYLKTLGLIEKANGVWIVKDIDRLRRISG